MRSTQSCAKQRRSTFAASALAAVLSLAMSCDPAEADGAALQQQLYDRMIQQPTNYDITLEYVRVATDRGDYEAAIGALERLLNYNPSLGQVKYQLGTLYYQLRAYEMAKRYFHEGLTTPHLDAGARASAENYLAEADRKTQPSRFSGFVQTGLRFQTNGNLAPYGDLVRFGAQDVLQPGGTKRQSDINAFQLVGLNHDWDLENQRGDVIETRFAGYMTQQARFNDLNVGLYEISIGPRMAIAPDFLPGATVKPYLIGGQTWVGGTKYQVGGGAGVTTQIPLGPDLSFGPSFEWRRMDFSIYEPARTSVFNSGDWYTAGFAISAAPAGVRTELRGYYRRGTAEASFQQFKQWIAEAAITLKLPSPAPSYLQNILVSPFVRYLKTEFDAPAPWVDPFVARADNQWVFGARIDTRMTKDFGFSAVMQFDHIGSSLPNYRQNNFSILAGPTAQF